MNILDFLSEIGIDIMIPPSCLGSYRSRLLFSCLWPVALSLIVIALVVCSELTRDRALPRSSRRGWHETVRYALQRTLPLVLVLSFLVVPSVATRIFKTFLCDPIVFIDPSDSAPGGITQRFLHDDLSLRCDSHEYAATTNTAIVMLFLWPVGTPVLYALLLRASTEAIINGSPTRLSRTTAFLSADCASAGIRTTAIFLSQLSDGNVPFRCC